MSCLTLSPHRHLGLPCDLLFREFHLNIFLTVLVSGILCTWPYQLSLWALIQLTIFLCFIILSNSSLVLILHIWFSFVGPNILLEIFLSKDHQFLNCSFFQHPRLFLLIQNFYRQWRISFPFELHTIKAFSSSSKIKDINTVIVSNKSELNILRSLKREASTAVRYEKDGCQSLQSIMQASVWLEMWKR